MEMKQTHSGCASMGDDKMLNIVVQKIISSNIQEFMRAWLTQRCKDFRLVFIQGKDTSKEEKCTMAYILNFAKALGLSDLVVCAASEAEVPKAEMTKVLRDTSVLPVDNMEVLRAYAYLAKPSHQEAALQEKQQEEKQCQKELQKPKLL